MNEASASRKSTSETSFLPKKYKKINLSYLENAGAYYLQRFPASVAQFTQVMKRKIDKSCRDHPDQSRESCLALLDQVVAKFIDLNYLNDTTYASALLYSLQLKNLSRSRILQTMKQKGVPGDLIEATVPEANSQDDLRAAIRWCQRKKLGHYATRERENATQRSLSALARAGFSYDCAQKALALTPDEAEDFLHEI